LSVPITEPKKTMKTIETTMAAVLAALFTPLSFAEPGDFIPTFGSGGVATADFGASSRLLGAAQMDSLGTNVAVGRVGAAPGVNDFALAFFGSSAHERSQRVFVTLRNSRASPKGLSAKSRSAQSDSPA